ncbi:NAD(P)-dependent oxidoreductase [Rhodobacteraceae bacterium M385]|nr:NAD(P)-dependent oxidoreductase [Rhodobacteraceae bacterium M385]
MSRTLPRVGVFGLGLIGRALAERLIAAGYRVTGTDVAADARDWLTETGGSFGSAAEVWAADVVFSCVYDTDQLAELIAQAPASPTILISLSTCDPDRMGALANNAGAKRITLLEAPISGTSKALAQGDVLLLVAGDIAAAETVAPLLDDIARQHIHVGEVGNGNRAKLAINLVLGLHRAALAEGMIFAESIGLAGSDFLQLAKASAAYSAVMDAKGALMVNRDFAPQGRIVQSAKDFALIQAQAQAAGQGLPFTRTYLEMMEDALRHDEGDLDNSAVMLPISRSRA